MSRPPSRRAVIKAFSMYLDYVVWKVRVQEGKEEPPEGDGISEMAQTVIFCEERWKELMEQHIEHEKQRPER